MAKGLIAFLLGFLLMIFWQEYARGDLLTIQMNENNRYYRNTGTITLYDPWEDKILGQYKFVTGGAGRGALPFGKYEIGSYRDDPGTSFTRDSPRFRRRWMIRQPGLNDGEAAGDWSLLELHSLHSSGRTAGCLGVAADDGIWDDFVSKLSYLITSVGDISFEVIANPDGSGGEVYEAVRHRPQRPTWKRHKRHHIEVAENRKHKRTAEGHKKHRRRA